MRSSTHWRHQVVTILRQQEFADAAKVDTAGGRRVAIIQSCYIPWKGYFDMISSVDAFVLLDDVQYTRRDWRNRNKIKTPSGEKWLTIPVQVKGKYSQKISETLVSGHDWALSHWQQIQQSYSKAPFFRMYKERLANLFEAAGRLDRLSAINHLFISEFCEMLMVDTPISWSSDYALTDGKTERLLEICKQMGASCYISGPAAQDYLDVASFADNGMSVEWFSYSGYLEYEQLHPPFSHSVSVIDLLVHTGPDASQHLKSRIRQVAGAGT